jgi:hypothetical protein
LPDLALPAVSALTTKVVSVDGESDGESEYCDDKTDGWQEIERTHPERLVTTVVTVAEVVSGRTVVMSLISRHM